METNTNPLPNMLTFEVADDGEEIIARYRGETVAFVLHAPNLGGWACAPVIPSVPGATKVPRVHDDAIGVMLHLAETIDPEYTDMTSLIRAMEAMV